MKKRECKCGKCALPGSRYLDAYRTSNISHRISHIADRTSSRVNTCFLFAFAMENEQIQLEWRTRLLKAGVQVTSVMDRVYFKSIYFHDPDGHILEIAKMGPGFLIDEGQEQLGKDLKLPNWLEINRKQIENSMIPVA